MVWTESNVFHFSFGTLFFFFPGVNRGGVTAANQHYFQLTLNLTSLDGGYRLGDYGTTKVAYDASAEEFKHRLQALPHVGKKVSVSRVGAHEHGLIS